MDANRVEAGPDTGSKSWTPAAAKFTRETDSPAEGGGFEPSVPPKRATVFETARFDHPALPFRERDRVVLERDRRFEARFLIPLAPPLLIPTARKRV